MTDITQIFDKYGNYDFPTDIKQDRISCKHLECNVDGAYCTAGHGHGYGWCVLPFKQNKCKYFEKKPKSKMIKLNENEVVISKDEYKEKFNNTAINEAYEMLLTQYKNLEIKYSNLSDNYRLCKDANETIKQHAITTRKETAREILERGKYCMPSGLREWIIKQYDIEIGEDK